MNMADPLLSSYSDSANLFSVLQTHETVDRFKQWVIDHYTGLYIINDPYSDADCSLSYTQNYGESLLLNCDLLEYRKFDRADVGPDGVASWIRQAIDEGFYVAVSLNKYYLPCAAEYRKRHFNHQTMFYGYDHRSGLLYAADGYKGGNTRWSRLLMRTCITPITHSMKVSIRYFTMSTYLGSTRRKTESGTPQPSALPWPTMFMEHSRPKPSADWPFMIAP